MKKTKKTMLIAAALTAAAGLAGCTNEPSDSGLQNVYGPPPDYLQEMDTEDESANEQPSDSTEEYDPADEEIPDVYGPPVDYEPSEDEIPAVYGPPEALD